MFRLRNNSCYNRPIDIGPNPKAVGSAAFAALNCLLSKGVPFAKRLNWYVLSFTGTTFTVPNPKNLACQCTLDVSPARSLSFIPNLEGRLIGVHAALRRTPFPPTFENAGVQGAYPA